MVVNTISLFSNNFLVLLFTYLPNSGMHQFLYFKGFHWMITSLNSQYGYGIYGPPLKTGVTPRHHPSTVTVSGRVLNLLG